MSISFSVTDGKSTLEQIREARLRANGGGGAKRTTSAKRVEANRRNAQRSTGPRSAGGKRRSSRNAMKHGLCRTLACLPSECEATFLTFVGELEEELRPATPLQRIAFNQIASLTWRLQRLPEAQVRIFEQELAKVEPDERDEWSVDGAAQLKPSDVLARRFSDDPSANGFALLERYERGLRSQLLRLMKHYDQLQKHRPTVPYDPDEPPCPPEGKQPAWTEEKARAQREWCAEQERRERAGEPTDPDWDELQANLRKAREQQHEQQQRQQARTTKALPAPMISPTAGHSASAAPRRSSGATGAGSRGAAVEDGAERSTVVARVETARGGAGALFRRGEELGTERTQSNPRENLVCDPPSGKPAAADDAPVTKRSQPTSLSVDRREPTIASIGVSIATDTDAGA